MADKILKKAGIKDKLGGVSKRFNQLNSYFTPGPGSYYKNESELSKKLNAAFIPKAKRNFNLIPNDIGPGIGHYNTNEFNTIGKGTQVKKGGGNSLFKFLSIDPSKRPAFQSVSPRFHLKS